MVDPREPVCYEDGTWNAYLGGHDGIMGHPNPVMVLHQVKNIQNINRVLSNGYVEITFLKDFKFKPSVNISLLNLKRRDFRPSTLAETNAPPPRNASMKEWNREIVNYNADMLLTYAKTIRDHSFDAMLGYTAQEETLKEMYGTGSKFPNDEIQIFQNAEIFSLTSAEYAWSLLAYFARLSYNYKDKYLLSASFRREGSSRFGANNRWGNFPSVSLGWKLSEEEFMPKTNWLSSLKLRGSYGVTGNNSIGNYSSLSGLNSANYIIGGSLSPGIVLGSFANSQLGWERSNSLDLGLDLSLFKNKLIFTFEYYNKITDNMLLQKEIPIITGFSNTYTNVGKIKNRGVEMALDYKTKVTQDFNFRGNFNISFNRNEVLEIMGENDYLEDLNFYNYYYRSVVGQPIGMFYGYKCLGIFNSDEEIANSPKQEGAVPGVYKYLDTNNDGEITYDSKDMVKIGNPHPKFIWAFTLAGDYKNFDFNILFTGAQDYDIIRNIEATTGNLDGVFNVAAAAKDRWRSAENPGKGKYPTTKAWKWEREISSRYVYDASHAWVKSFSIGYTIPRTNSILKGARFYVNAENLFLITKYPGSNPDINTNDADKKGINLGRDDEAYPVPRIFTVGTSITF
jgi:TonB-linked SusC/RagA family outer membrane protein